MLYTIMNKKRTNARVKLIGSENYQYCISLNNFEGQVVQSDTFYEQVATAHHSLFEPAQLALIRRQWSELTQRAASASYSWEDFSSIMRTITASPTFKLCCSSVERYSLTFDVFQTWTGCLDSLPVPTKLVSLSNLISIARPRRHINRCEASMNGSASNKCTTSTCTAPTVKHVNKHPYLLCYCVQPSLESVQEDRLQQM